MTDVAGHHLAWNDVAEDDGVRVGAARAIVAALFLPDQPVGKDRMAPLAEQEPSELIGIAARARYSALRALATRPDAPLTPERVMNGDSPGVSRSENGDVVGADRPGSRGDDCEVYGLVGRVGQGGRKQRDGKRQLTEETRELYERLGSPFEERTVAGGVIVKRWLRDPEGSDAWFLRLSPTGQDKSQETISTQLHEQEAQLNDGRLKEPRWIVATLMNSGARRPHERYDLMLMREWIEEGWLRQVVFRNEKRLARQQFTLAWCQEIFESTGTDIYFTEYGRCVDWESPNDRMLFVLKGMFAAEDRRAIVTQTQNALDRQYVDAGKGWPGLQQVGLMRDPLSGFMVEDEEQTEMILRGARMFVSRDGAENTGLKWVAEEMKERFKFELSPKQWERVLKNEGFVTGDFAFNRKGRGKVPLKHIDLVHRIPPSLFHEIQTVFATNKGTSRSRSGDFVLLRGGDGQQGVPASEKGIFCKRCGGKLRAWLQGEENDTRYRHHGRVPESCKGWGGIERSEIEPVVIRELWRLEDVRELREAAVRAAAFEDVRVSAYLDHEQRKQIQKDIDDIAREIARLGREYRRLYLHGGKAAKSRKNHIEAYNDLVEGLKADKEQLEARLAQADALEAVERSVPPSVDRGLSKALREVLTLEVPEDDAACRRRAAVYGRIVTKLVVDKRDDGTFTVEIYGPLVPRDLPMLEVPAPSGFAVAQLVEYRANRRHATASAGQALFQSARADLLTRRELQDSSEGTPYDERCSWRFAWRYEVAGLHRPAKEA
jgi:DNA invertase Pin-like site-specific DNA recombinase